MAFDEKGQADTAARKIEICERSYRLLVDKINFPKLARVARLVYAIGWEVAEKSEPVKRDRTWAELPQRRRRR